MKKNIILLASLLIIVISSYIWLISVPATEGQNDTPTQIPLFGIDQSLIHDIIVKNQNDNFELTIVDGVWHFKDDQQISVIQPKADGLAYDLSQIVAERLVEENASDLTAYGLDPAVSTVMARLNDGTEHIFYVGNRVQDKMEYYFKTGNDNNIYTVYIGKGQMFSSKREDFKNRNLTSVPQDQIKSIRITKANKNDMFIAKEVLENGSAQWIVKNPYEWNASTSLIQSEILSKITGLTAIEFVSNKTLEEMGLNSPVATVSVEKNDGSFVNYKIGTIDEKGNCYLIVDGVKEAVTVTSTVSSITDVDVFNITDKTIYSPEINKVNSIIVKGINKTVKLECSEENDKKVYKINGAEVSVDSYAKSYANVISLKLDQVSSKKLDNQTNLYIKYVLNDGSTKQFVFYSYDDRNYAITKDGTNFFIIRKAAFDAWFESINIIF